MKLVSFTLSLVVAAVALVAVESASAQGFGYQYSWSSSNNCQPGYQQNCQSFGNPGCQPGMYNRGPMCPPQYQQCPPQYGMNPGYCPPRQPSFYPSAPQPQFQPRCGTGMIPRQYGPSWGSPYNQ